MSVLKNTTSLYMNPDKVFENDDIVVFNKPSGLLSIPDRFNSELPCILNIASKKYEKLWVLHRLDKDTSGCIAFAKSENAHRLFSSFFLDSTVEKFYEALVCGIPLNQSGSIKEPIVENPAKRGTMMIHPKGKKSHTDYMVLNKWQGYSHLNLQIHTGRTHQIRVHLKHIGHPIVGDAIYGIKKSLYLSDIKKKYRLPGREKEQAPLLNRLALHSARLIFHPENSEPIIINAPLPKDMLVTIKQLEKWNK